jgi:hypothetical protein
MKILLPTVGAGGRTALAFWAKKMSKYKIGILFLKL